MEAIKEMRKPENKKEVRSFLGMIYYYGKFIPKLSEIVFPLNQLFRNEVDFSWSKEHDDAFKKAKNAFLSPRCLIHFNPKLPLVLTTDASPYGVGAILSHILPDGSEKVIRYVSQTLSENQRKYAQIDKEVYAIVYGIKKFHQFIYGNKFTLITDHRPLVQIFWPTKGLLVFSAMRMQHYALFLQGYNYTIKYRKSEEHSNAECLSRLPIRGYDVRT